MKRFIGRVTMAALVLAVASAPAMAGGRGGYWGGYGGGHHHYRGSSNGWWVGGAVALTSVGLIAASSRPGYVQTGVYSSGVGYTSPPLYAAPVAMPVYGTTVYQAAPVYNAPVYQAPPVYNAPVYQAPPVAYPVPVPVPAYPPVVYAPAPQAEIALADASYECRRWAMNESGHDPSNITPWTTKVMIDSYNRARDSCMESRGYRGYRAY